MPIHPDSRDPRRSRLWAAGMAAAFALVSLGFAGCPEKAPRKADMLPAGEGAPTPDAPAPAGQAPVKEGKLREVAPDEFPRVDLGGLTSDQRSYFAFIAEDELCRCAGSMATLAGCLKEKATCDLALRKARYIVRQLQAGAPVLDLQTEISTEYHKTFRGEAKTVDIDGAAMRGAAAAQVTIVEFADFQCPFCRAVSGILKELLKTHEGKIKLYFKHFPLTMHTEARSAAKAAEAAGRQGKFWEMHDYLYEHQEAIGPDLYAKAAAALGLDTAKFKADMDDEGIRVKIDKDKNAGTTLGVDSTPSLFINGRLYTLAREPADLAERIEDALLGDAAADKVP